MTRPGKDAAATRPGQNAAAPRGWPLAAIVAGIVVIAAACVGSAPAPTVPGADLGSSSEGPSGSGTMAAASPATGLDPRDAEVAWARCMRQHGIDIPDPGAQVGSATVQIDKGSTTFDAAVTACQDRLPASLAGANETPDPAYIDRMLVYARCMREHGINMPDPQSGSGQPGTVSIVGDQGTGSGPGLFDPASRVFDAADRACGGKGGKGSDPGAAGGGAPAPATPAPATPRTATPAPTAPGTRP